MEAAVIIQLLTTFGPPAINLIDKLIVKWKTNDTVTVEEWAELSAALKLTAADHMSKQLTASGIDPTSEQGKAFLALTTKS